MFLCLSLTSEYVKCLLQLHINSKEKYLRYNRTFRLHCTVRSTGQPSVYECTPSLPCPPLSSHRLQSLGETQARTSCVQHSGQCQCCQVWVGEMLSRVKCSRQWVTWLVMNTVLLRTAKMTGRPLICDKTGPVWWVYTELLPGPSRRRHWVAIWHQIRISGDLGHWRHTSSCHTSIVWSKRESDRQ